MKTLSFVFFAVLMVFVAALFGSGQYGAAYLCGFVGMAAIAKYQPSGQLCANVIASPLQITEIMDAALQAFRPAILPLRAIAAVFDASAMMKGTNKMAIPVYPLSTGSVVDIAPGDSFKAKATGSVTQAREITINKRKGVGLSFSSTELNRQPQFDPARHGMLKAWELAAACVADVFSLITAANFPGSTIAAVNPATFDEQEMADLGQKCMESDWPLNGHGLAAVLNPALYFGLIKRPAILSAQASGTTGPLQQGELPNIMGFDMIGSNGVPQNGAEKIGGFVTLPSSILCGFAPIEPSVKMKERLADWQIYTDKESGIALQYRHIVYEDTEEEVQFMDVSYGYAVGLADQLKRIVTI